MRLRHEKAQLTTLANSLCERALNVPYMPIMMR